MEEKRREELGLIVQNFIGKATTNEAIQEYCKKIKIDPVTTGKLKDYIAQVEHDKAVSKIYPEILAELQKLQYRPEFDKESKRKEIAEKNDEVRVSITKLFEKAGIRYLFVEPMGQELGNFIGQTVTSAGTTAFNKGTEVLFHIASKHFNDNNFTMAQVEKYAKELFEKKKEVK